ncbi:MAG: copper resistance protein B [Gemmatimonadaceae bacterium]
MTRAMMRAVRSGRSIRPSIHPSAHLSVRIVIAAILCLLGGLSPIRTAVGQQLPSAGLPIQEHDDAVYQYTQLELDAARSRGSVEGTIAGEGWVGTDFNRLWWQTAAEREGGRLDNAAIQLLYGRYVRQFWDAQIGYRRVFRPGGGNYLVAGFQGLAPYRFEVAAWGALSDRGRVSFRGEAAYELLWTQRLISRPALSADIFTSSDPAYGQRGAGLGDVEVRLPTRYEFSRQFAPYAEVRYTRRTPGEEALSRGADVGANGGAPASNWTLRGGLWLVF